MKAVVLERTPWGITLLTDLVAPSLKPGQVRVKIAYSGVCHSQLMEVEGLRGEDRYLPHLLGHEATGVVTETGPEVKKVKTGDKVILGWIKGEGHEAGGTVFKQGEKSINAGAITTFSDETIVSENRCVKLPKNIPLDVGVLFGCALPTGAGMVMNTLALKPEESLVIFGAGGIGLCALMAAKAMGIHRRIVVDIKPEKLELANELGATDIIDASRGDPVKLIKERVTGGVNASIDSAGLTLTIEQAFEALSPKGRCVFASHPAYGEKIKLDPHALISGKKIQGSWGGETQPDRDIPIWAKWYEEAKLPLEKLLTKRYLLKDIKTALEDLRAGRVSRPLVEINPDLG